MIVNWNKNPFKVLYNSTYNVVLNLGVHRHGASNIYKETYWWFMENLWMGGYLLHVWCIILTGTISWQSVWLFMGTII